MADVVGSVTKIVEVALKIKEAVDTVRQNKEVCVQIRKRVSRLSAIMLHLNMEMMETMKEPAMRETLLELEGALLRALGLVTSCQEKNRVSLTFTAGKLSKQLYQVKQDISDHMMEVILATNVQVTIMITRHYQEGVHLSSQRCHYLLPSDGSEVNGKKVNALHGETIPWAPDSLLKDEATPPYNVLRTEATANCFFESVDTSNCNFKGFISYSFSDLEDATNNFSKEHVIGEGGCATIYKGVLPDGLMVAIKRFLGAWGPQSVMQYAGVFSMLLQHENIVRFLGYCHEDKQEMVVEEYMPKGNLSRVIDGSLHTLDWSSTFRIIQGIAEGIAYLHAKNIIHMVLKPDNVLFDSDMNPKICDFDSSVMLDQAVTQTVTDELVGTIGYIPPEYLSDGVISVKNDVYSFGILILCILSGLGKDAIDIREITTPRYCHDSINWAWEARQTAGIESLDPSVRNRERCMEIGLLCTQVESIDRPTMPDVLQMLSGYRKIPTPTRYKVPKKRSRIMEKLLHAVRLLVSLLAICMLLGEIIGVEPNYTQKQRRACEL